MDLTDFWNILVAYGAFTIVVAAAAHYELISPVMQLLNKFHPTNTVVENYNLSVATFFVLSMFLAPVVLPICLLPSLSEKFRLALLKGLKQV